MKIKGFTPIFDNLSREYDLYTAAVYGKIWRICDWSPMHICSMSNEKMAKQLGISEKTVRRKKEFLVEKGLLKITGRTGKTDTVDVNHDIMLEMHGPPTPDTESTPSDSLSETSDTESDKDSIKDSKKEEKDKKEENLLLAASGVDPHSDKRPKFKNPDWVPPDLKDGNKGKLWNTWCNLFLKLRPNKNFLKGDKRWISEIRNWDNMGYKSKHIKSVWETLKPEDFAYISGPKSLNTKLQTLTAQDEYPDFTDPSHVLDV